MIPFDLVRWFRRRMLPLVIAAAGILLVAAPASYHLAKRRELWQEARASAVHVGAALCGEIELRPLLWRYDMPKLTERLAVEGLLGVPRLVIHDADGVAVPLDLGPQRPVRGLIWGRAEVVALGRHAATVWVGADAAPLWRGTAVLAAVFALLAMFLGTVLYLMPMRAVGTAQRRIRTLLGQLALTLQEEDRRRIARDLHDGAGQALTAARLRLLALERRIGPGEEVADLARLLDEAIAELRRSAYALAPPALEELGLARALERHCEAFAAAAGLEVHREIDAHLGRLPPTVEMACYRIVQEALSNAARHAAARSVWVRLVRDGGWLRLDVHDDGKAQADPPEGQGLPGIRERARLLGGAASITILPGQGLRLEVALPVEPL